MEDVASIETIAGVISLAVAPVFLLAGIAGLLAVMSTRLGRITDRARVIERRIPDAVGLREVGIATGRMKLGMEATISSSAAASRSSKETPRDSTG